jgi:hypothetical protein
VEKPETAEGNPIPGTAFATVDRVNTKGSLSLYPKGIAVDKLIWKACGNLGVTRFQLDKLLGLANPNQV